MLEFSNACVLTGDLVGSTELEVTKLNAAFDNLGIAESAISLWQTESPRLTRYRGDGWQLFIQNPRLGLKAAVLAKSAVMAAGSPMDTRIALGMGDAFLETSDLGSARGSAFVASGQLLDAMGSKDRIAAKNCQIIAPIVPLVVALTDNWTFRQAEIAFLVLRSPQALTFAEMGTFLGISRQAAQKRYDAAGLRALLECFDALTNMQPN